MTFFDLLLRCNRNLLTILSRSHLRLIFLSLLPLSSALCSPSSLFFRPLSLFVSLHVTNVISPPLSRFSRVRLLLAVCS